MTLDKKTMNEYRRKAHNLKPVVMIGNNGLTQNVNMEIERALHDHELIKIRIQSADRQMKQELFQEICGLVKAEAVQLIGGIGVLYRKREE